jgi:hypothetical protein
MVTIEVAGPEVLERWKGEAAANCAPLYIQDALLFDGHDATTKNATATFVKFEGRYYACTCRHTVDIVNKRRAMGTSPFPTLALGLKKRFINLSLIGTDGLRDAISVVQPSAGQDYFDLAIADISEHWHSLSAEWGNRAIEMNPENWREPRWARAKLLAAAGWPEIGKRNVTVNGIGRVRGTVTLIIADVSGGISRHDDIILMNTRLDAPHGWFFSGVSGGPIYVLQDELMVPVGILYEGWPQTKDDRHDEFTPNDIVIRGVTLTPSSFERWLSVTNNTTSDRCRGTSTKMQLRKMPKAASRILIIARLQAGR